MYESTSHDDDFVADYKTDFMVPLGSDLEDGMEVLIASDIERRRRPGVTDQWCRIEGKLILGSEVVFIARYKNGNWASRSCMLDHPWYVRKDSLKPDSKWQKIFDEAEHIDKLLTAAEEEMVMQEKNTPEEFVDKYYIMDPNTDELLFDGECLQRGMKVIVGDPAYRIDLGLISDPEARHRALMMNRWCVIDEVEVTVNTVSLIGIYDDGVKMKQSLHVSAPWYVKKDTLEAEDEIVEEKKVSNGVVSLPFHNMKIQDGSKV